MTTEEMIEEFIDLGMKAYKKNSKNSPEAWRLTRHEPITIDGYEFCCWKEYTVYKMAEYIKDTIPDSNIEVELDGNDSTIKIIIDDSEQEELNRQLFLILKKFKNKS